MCSCKKFSPYYKTKCLNFKTGIKKYQKLANKTVKPSDTSKETIRYQELILVFKKALYFQISS